jgi:hypothetical protein
MFNYLETHFYKDVRCIIESNKQIDEFDYNISKVLLENSFTRYQISLTYGGMLEGIYNLVYNCFVLEYQHNRYQYTLQNNSKSTPEDYINCAKEKIRTTYLLFVYKRHSKKALDDMYNILCMKAKINEQKYNSLLHDGFSAFVSAKKDPSIDVGSILIDYIDRFIKLYK